MHDVIDWRDLLTRDVTAVEEPGRHFYDNLSRMYDVARAIDVDFELLRAKVEMVIIRGTDLDNVRPRRVSIVEGRYRFAYDVVNLDFDGGLGNVLARHRAIQALFAAQQQTAFTLLITYNVRHQVHVAVAQELQNLRSQLGGDGDRAIDWYAATERPETLRLKAIVPAIVAASAAAVQLDCVAYPPVRYIGHKKATMMHFVFDMSPRAKAFRGHTQSSRDLVTLPLIDVVDGNLHVSKQQDPLYNEPRCEAALGFLPAEVQNAILER